MGHGKLRKFAENETFRCLLQPEASGVLAPREAGDRSLRLRDHAIKGHWGEEMFGNDHPIVLELGCGKGDYTIALALRHPEINYIGVDIKGARLWKGAKYATEHQLPNVAFLRTRIEFISAFFGPSEVSEIWLTFSDPQLRGSENSRLSSPLFLERYRSFMRPGGVVHLKTDSRFLYEYTLAVCTVNGLQVLASGTDIYHEGLQAGFGSTDRRSATPPTDVVGGPLPLTRQEAVMGQQAGFGSTDRRSATPPTDNVGGPLPLTRPRVAMGPQTQPLPAGLSDVEAVFEVQTFYEKMFLEMGLPITYMAFCIDHEGPYAFPGEAFDNDHWLEAEGPRRSFSHQPAKR